MSERESLEMDFRCLFDFLQIPLLREAQSGGEIGFYPLLKVYKESSDFGCTLFLSSHLPHPKFRNIFYDFGEEMIFHVEGKAVVAFIVLERAFSKRN